MKNKSININTIIYFLLLVPFFKPTCISFLYPKINIIYKLLQIISCLAILLLFLKKMRISKFIIYISLFQLIILVATFLNDGDIKTVIFDTIQVIATAIIIEIGLQNKKNSLIKSLLFIYEILLTINLITIFLYPNGMYVHPISHFRTNWFLGHDNNHIVYILSGIMVSFIYSYIEGKKVKARTIYLLIISIISIIVRKSATSIIGLSLLLLYVIFKKYIDRIKIANIYTYIITSFVVSISIVIFRIQNIFKYIIVDILHKDITFTGRTYIWDMVLKYIESKPILGYGYEDGLIRQAKYKYIGAVHTHNQLLEIIYQGGSIALLVFIFIIVLIAKELYEYKDNKIAHLISWTLFTYFIMVITEVFSIDRIIIIFTFGYNIKYLINTLER